MPPKAKPDNTATWKSDWCNQCIDRVGSRRYRKLHPEYGWCVDCLNNPRFTRPDPKILEIIPQQVAIITERKPRILTSTREYPGRISSEEERLTKLLQELIIWLAKRGEMSYDWAEAVEFFFSLSRMEHLRELAKGEFDDLKAVIEDGRLQAVGRRLFRRGNSPKRITEEYFLRQTLALLKGSPATFNQLRQQLGIKRHQRSYDFYPRLLRKIAEREDSPIERCQNFEDKSVNRAYWQIRRPQQEIELALSSDTYERLEKFRAEKQLSIDSAMQEFLMASGY